MTDKFGGYSDAPHFPARNFLDIDAEKSDTVDLSHVPKGIVASTGGTVSMVGHNGVTVSVTLTANVVYPYSPKRVRNAGTSASGIIGLH